MAKGKKNKKKVLSGGNFLFKLFGEFTVKWLAKQLKEIEENSTYETAILCANAVNYKELCTLAINSEEGDDNDPHWMPSRFMLLPGANDDTLREKEHLDEFQHTLHSELTNKELSVANLAQGLKDIGLLNATYEVVAFDTVIKDAYFEFLSHVKTPSENVSDFEEQFTHTVQKGETLSSIQTTYSLPSWYMLYEINESDIENQDVLTEGQEIRLPTRENNPLRDKMEKYDFEKYLGGECYQYTYYYFSMSLYINDEEEFAFDGDNTERDCCFYIKKGDKNIPQFSITLTSFDEINVLLPRNPNLRWGVKGAKFYYEGLIFVHPDDLQYDDNTYEEPDEIYDGATGNIVEFLEL